MKTLKVTVTDAHILLGIPSDKMRCPISLAVREAAEVIEVSTDAVFITKKMRNWGVLIYQMPSVAKKFVGNFDIDKYSVAPIEFEAEQVNYYKISK